MLRMPSLAMVDMNELSESLKTASTETVLLESGWAAVGKTIGEMQIRTRTGASIIAITRNGDTNVNPGPETTLEAEDVLVLIGDREQLDRAVDVIHGSLS